MHIQRLHVRTIVLFSNNNQKKEEPIRPKVAHEDSPIPERMRMAIKANIKKGICLDFRMTEM